MRKPENDNPKWQAKRWEHGDYIFAAVTIALMAFFFGAGFGAWMFNYAGTAAENPPAPRASVR